MVFRTQAAVGAVFVLLGALPARCASLRLAQCAVEPLAEGAVRVGEMTFAAPAANAPGATLRFDQGQWAEEALRLPHYALLTYRAQARAGALRLRRHVEVTPHAVYITDVISAAEHVALDGVRLAQVVGARALSRGGTSAGLRWVPIVLNGEQRATLLCDSFALRLAPLGQGLWRRASLAWQARRAAGAIALDCPSGPLERGEDLFFSLAIVLSPAEAALQSAAKQPPLGAGYVPFDPLRGPIVAATEVNTPGATWIGPAWLSPLALAHGESQDPTQPQDPLAADLILRLANVLIAQDQGDLAPRVLSGGKPTIVVRRCDVVLALACAYAWTGVEIYREHLQHYLRLFSGNTVGPGCIAQRSANGLAVFPSDGAAQGAGYRLADHLIALDQARAIGETLGEAGGEAWWEVVRQGLRRLRSDMPQFRRGARLLASAGGAEELSHADAVRALVSAANLLRATGDALLRGLLRELARLSLAAVRSNNALADDPWLWGAAIAAARAGEPRLLFSLLREKGQFVRFPPGSHYVSQLGQPLLRAPQATAAGSDWILSRGGRVYLGGRTIVDSSGATFTYNAFDPILLPLELEVLADEGQTQAEIFVEIFGPNGLGAHLRTESETVVTVKNLLAGEPYVLSATWELEGMILVADAQGRVRIMLPGQEELDFWVERAGI